MKIGIIGVGTIGGIFAQRLLESLEGLEELYLFDRYGEKLNGFASRSDRVRVAGDPTEMLCKCDQLIVAVKPQDSSELLVQLKNGDKNKNDPVLISTIAGGQISVITKKTGMEKIVRIMPNIPSAIGKGVTGVVYSPAVSLAERAQVEKTLETLGEVVQVREKDFAAVTALSGSGPAFAFVIIESLIDVGLKMGLSYAVARDLILATLEGSVELLRAKKDSHPGELKHMVASPGGTTIEGIYSLEREGLRGKIMKALFDTYLRAQELNRELEANND